LITVTDQLARDKNGGFFGEDGGEIPW